MNRLRAFAFLVLAFALASTAQGQPEPLVEIEEDEKFDLAKRLRERFGDIQQKNTELDLFQKLLEAAKKSKSPDDLKKLLKDNPLLNDTAMLEKLSKFAIDKAKQQGGGNLPQVKDLGKLIDKLKNDPKVQPDPVDPNDPNGGQNVAPPTPPAPTPEEERAKLAGDPRMQKWLRWAEKNIGPLAENPAVRDALMDIAGGDFGDLGGDFNSILGDIGEFEADFKDLGDWASKQVGDPSSWELPAIDLGIGSGGGPVGGGSSGGTEYQARPTETSWLPVIVLALLAVAGLAYWYIRGMERRAHVAPEPTIEERLGPWPVDPRTIRTSEQLVRAFEYLSLTECGLETKTWNHVEIAAELREKHFHQPDRVEKLAGLYEQARYAPATPPLSPAQIDDGRRALCSLIGVPTS